MKKETTKTLRHIFDARIYNADSNDSYHAWLMAKILFEYAIVDNIDCLKEFDYLLTEEETEEMKKIEETGE